MSDRKLDDRKKCVKVVLSLGSNLGESFEYLQSAVNELAAIPFFGITAISSVYLTDPVGTVPQPDFLNAVVIGQTFMTPEELIGYTQKIERKLGRVRDIPKGPRTIDIDIISIADVQQKSLALTLPHPAVSERAFVLIPWLEVDPDAFLPGAGMVSDLLELIETAGVQLAECKKLAVQ